MTCPTCGRDNPEDLIAASQLVAILGGPLTRTFINAADFAALGGELSRYPTARERFVWWIHDRLESMGERLIRWSEWWRT